MSNYIILAIVGASILLLIRIIYWSIKELCLYVKRKYRVDGIWGIIAIPFSIIAYLLINLFKKSRKRKKSIHGNPTSFYNMSLSESIYGDISGAHYFD